MILNYSDEESRLSDKLKLEIEAAAKTAIATEIGAELDVIDKLNAELSITVVSAEEIKEINSEYRGIDKVTDVLSFPQFQDVDELVEAIHADDEFGILLGDVVICYDRALEQAEEYGTGRDREIVYLATHSVFHLLGYDHMEEDEKKQMRAREEEVMSIIGLGRD